MESNRGWLDLGSASAHLGPILKKDARFEGYVRRLPNSFRTRYGAEDTYAVRQVKSTIRRLEHRSALDRDRYGRDTLVIFNDFAFDQNGIWASYNYDGMRSEVSSAHFRGADFTIHDVFALSMNSGGEGGGSHHDDADGGDGGGGGN